MKRITLYLLLAANACFGATTYYIEPGSVSFGAGRGSLSNQVTVTLTGAPSTQQRIYNYFDFSGQLNIALPPGVSGACTGAPCNIFTTDANSSSVYNPTPGTAPTLSNAPTSYAVMLCTPPHPPPALLRRQVYSGIQFRQIGLRLLVLFPWGLVIRFLPMR
ncbi:MAG: hypothetical protein JO150_07240, partial [Acidobacteriaceae bacterium]|nr:hypothetical protein [Acidobacteriaceae bacterium]